ncbi:MAG TPA: hypothetical protein VM925_04920 [Labilithrix sp.]|nr:hypothetical protein [Labilithrix sp.]
MIHTTLSELAVTALAVTALAGDVSVDMERAPPSMYLRACDQRTDTGSLGRSPAELPHR